MGAVILGIWDGEHGDLIWLWMNLTGVGGRCE
jgi:hypothetical protein